MAKKLYLNLLTLLFITFCALPLCAAAPAAVTIQGRKILVNGKQFNMQGVNYSPVTVGYDSTYVWGNFPLIYNTDLPLIKAMGANTIRTYQESNITQAFLDSAYQNGVYVIVGWTENLWGKNFATGTDTAQALSDFKIFVNKWKNHPAVLMWCFGNEVEVHTNGGEASWYTLLSSAAAMVQSIDSNHPVTTANSEIFEVGDASLKADDLTLSATNFVWGVNCYRGKNFNDAFFTEMSTRTAKPFFLAEFGCDAWNGLSNVEDDSLQDTCIRSQWADISANLASGGKTCSGGLVFEWCDEWWKGDKVALTTSTISLGGVGGNSIHDTENDWYNFAYDDYYMNEEWWGLVSVAQGTTNRTPRLAYNSLKSLWYSPDNVNTSTGTTTTTTSSVASSGIIQGVVRNFPNPFLAGRDTTKVRFTVNTVNGSPTLEVIVFDLTGRKVHQLDNIIDNGNGEMEADWDGKDDNSELAPAGLYICRVKAKNATEEEVRYRKIVVVK